MSSHFTTTFDSKLFAYDHRFEYRKQYYPEHVQAFKTNILPKLNAIADDSRCALKHAKAGDFIIVIPLAYNDDASSMMRSYDDYTGIILEVYPSPYEHEDALLCPSPKQHINSESYRLRNLNEAVVFYLHPDHHHIFEYTNDKPKRGSVLPRFGPLIPDAL